MTEDPPTFFRLEKSSLLIERPPVRHDWGVALFRGCITIPSMPKPLSQPKPTSTSWTYDIEGVEVKVTRTAGGQFFVSLPITDRVLTCGSEEEANLAALHLGGLARTFIDADRALSDALDPMGGEQDSVQPQGHE